MGSGPQLDQRGPTLKIDAWHRDVNLKSRRIAPILVRTSSVWLPSRTDMISASPFISSRDLASDGAADSTHKAAERRQLGLARIRDPKRQIGRASCRERVFRAV